MNTTFTRLFAAALTTLTFATIANALGDSAQTTNAQIAGKRLQTAIENGLPAPLETGLRSQVRDVRMDVDRLMLDMKQLQDGISNLPLQYRASLLDKLSDVRAGLVKDNAGTVVLKPSPSPTPAASGGQYCTVSCATLSGTVDQSTLIGARGLNTLVATQAASDKLKQTYTCNYSQVAGSCAAVGANDNAVTCQSACQTLSGTPDLGSAAVANGANELEATVNSQAALKAKYDCNYGMMKVTCLNN